jgi:hypothetical protein
MQINILRIVVEIAIECYVISLILFTLFTFFFKISSLRKAIFLNSINTLGLLSSIVTFGDEIYFFFKTTKRNFELPVYLGHKGDWLILAPMVGFLLIIIVFLARKRRQNMGWSLVGLLLLVLLKLFDGLHSWLMHQQCLHKPPKILPYFISINNTLLLYIMFFVGIFSTAWIHHKIAFRNRSPKIEA